MLVLIWSNNGRTYQFKLKSDRYFLGRPTIDDLGKFKEEFDIANILIFNPDDYNEVCNTGFISLTVSRRHALLYKKSVGGNVVKLFIKDHGPLGKGSKNGTLVNDEMLPKGGVKPVSIGDTIRLSRTGPIFHIGVLEGNKAKMYLSEGVPIELASKVAEKLAIEGVVAESAKVGSNVLAVINRVGKFEIDKNLIVEVKNISKYKEIIQTIHSLENSLWRIKEDIIKGRIDEAVNHLYALDMEVYKSALKMVGGEKVINILYNEILEYVKITQGNLSEEHIKKVDICLKMLQNILNNVLMKEFF